MSAFYDQIKSGKVPTPTAFGGTDRDVDFESRDNLERMMRKFGGPGTRLPTRAPTFFMVAMCHGCQQQHTYEVTSFSLSQAVIEWESKHKGVDCRSEFKHILPEFRENTKDRAAWEVYGHNTDFKFAYVASGTYTISPASLATSSSRTAGREGTSVSNSTNKYLDYLIGGLVTTGTTPTVSTQIDISVYAAVNDTPLYPDVLDGTDSAETITSENVRNGAITLMRSILVDNTSDRGYWSAPISLASLFGGVVPTHHGLFIAHSTVAAFNATAGNHLWYYTPIYATGT